jgi:hypothetical protein
MSWEIRQRAQAAARDEQRLVKAITQRGAQLNADPERVNAAIQAARVEIRTRGAGHEQIMGDLPASPVECCGDCYDAFMNDADEF